MVIDFGRDEMIKIYDATAIIDGRLYDTSIAKEIFSHEKIPEKIFVMPKGDYFTVRIKWFGGTELTDKGEIFRSHLEYNNILPISKKDVMDIVEQLDKNKFKELFPNNIDVK